MLQMRELLPLGVIAAVLSCPLASSAETIIDEWSSVKAPPPPELKSVTLDLGPCSSCGRSPNVSCTASRVAPLDEQAIKILEDHVWVSVEKNRSTIITLSERI